jgi:hypothetical protein
LEAQDICAEPHALRREDGDSGIEFRVGGFLGSSRLSTLNVAMRRSGHGASFPV